MTIRLRLALLALLVGAFATSASGYWLFDDRWADGKVGVHLQLGSSGGPLADGSADWGASTEQALALWNMHLARLEFRVARNSTAPIGPLNDINNVFFDDDVYGDAFGDAVAMTYFWWTDGIRTEADVVFNTSATWNSYRGLLRYDSSGRPLYDMRRVALHEFGHVLGLDHPDQHGQTVPAVMNARVDDVDALQADDIIGGRALYGSTSVSAGAIDTLLSGARLLPNEYLQSVNGRYRLLYQADGNLVLSDQASGTVLWSSDTGGLGASAVVPQGDGDLVIYDGAGAAVWSTATGGQGRARLVVQDDGNLVLYRLSDAQPIWDRSVFVPLVPRSPATSERLTGTLSATGTGCTGSGSGSSACQRHTFTVSQSGTVEGRLTWAGAANDLDLELWRGGARVSSSDGLTAQEVVSAAVTVGTYEWRVVYYGGRASESYTLDVTRPN